MANIYGTPRIRYGLHHTHKYDNISSISVWVLYGRGRREASSPEEPFMTSEHICVSMSIRANNLIISMRTMYTIWVSNTAYNKKLECKDENRQGRILFSFLQIQKYTSCYLPNGNIFSVYLHKFYVLLTKLEIKKYFHIWSGPNRVFWNAKDYGFLSVKKVKTQFLAKWRNEDWRFSNFLIIWRLNIVDYQHYFLIRRRLSKSR